MKEYSVVGKRIPRLEGIAKATGQAQYTEDVHLPNMLYGKVLHSPYAHARILNIDTSHAFKLPGVKAVITGADVLPRKYGVYARTSDQYALAKEKVRYIGEEVASVAAIDEAIAEEALSLIKVDYEMLPAVFDFEEAMKPGAPRIHDVENNIMMKIGKNVGDVEKGFSEADYIREDVFKHERQAHCAMEPYSIVAAPDSSGRLSVWVPSTSPFAKRLLLAMTLNKPERDIRICKTYTGGAFGGKGTLYGLEFSAALLSLKTGKPVKITHSREETFISTWYRVPMIIKLKTGVKKDGALTAREAQVIGQAGAYAATTIMAVYITVHTLFATYKVPNFRYEGLGVYTNTPICGALRGHGGMQARFADESQMDIISEEMGFDPVEFRLKNALRQGDIDPFSKQIVSSCALSECIEKTVEKAGWKEKAIAKSQKPMVNNKGLGLGCTTGWTAVKINKLCSSGAFIKFNEDGSINLITGAVENGQGTETMLAQIAAEELGLSANDIRVVSGDTDGTPTDVGSNTMSATFVSGNAVKKAASDAKQQILQIASEMLEAPPDVLEIANRRIYIRERPEVGVELTKVIRNALFKGVPLLGKGYYTPRTDYLDVVKGEGKAIGSYSFSSEVIEVGVDPETGEVKMLDTTLAHDCGYPINPMDVEGQIEGCASLSHAMALKEEMYWQDGKMLNPSFLTYFFPTAMDESPIKTIIVESAEPDGPFGGKEAGEGPCHTGPGAVANAIYHAAGVRIKEVPIGPHQILKALQEKKA